MRRADRKGWQNAKGKATRLSRDAEERAETRVHSNWLPEGRAVAFAVVMVALSSWETYLATGATGVPQHSLPALFPLVALGVWAAARYPVSVGGRRMTVAVQACEAPALLGVVFLPPTLTVVAFSLGYLPATWPSRRSWAQVMANWACYLVPLSVAPVLYHRLAGQADARSAAGWLAGAVVLAVLVVGEAVLASGMLALLHRRWRRRPGWPAALDVTARLAAGAGVGLVATVLVDVYPWTVVLFSAVAVAAAVAYRATVVAIRRYANLHAVYESTRRLAPLTDAHEVMAAVLQDALRLLRATHVEVVVPLDKPVDHLVSRAVLGRDGRPRFAHGELMTRLDKLAQAGGGAVYPGGPEDAEVTGLLDDAGIGNAMVAPLNSDSTPSGYLMVADRPFGEEQFRPSDLKLFETLATNAGAALRRSDLMCQLRSEVSVRQYQSRHDTLTGMPNRLALSDRLHDVLGSEAEGDVAVLFVDIEGFKDVNDTLGHVTGDAVLREVAGRLLGLGRGPEIVARLGGDEFAVLLSSVVGREELEPAAAQLLAMLAQPIEVGELRLDLRASLGVALTGADDRLPDALSLMRHAEVAMYMAKEAGGGVQFYDAARDRSTVRRLTLATELRRALGTDALDVWYQPLVSLGTGEVTGCEALLRWQHAEFGPISPSEFIPVAENAGLIDDLTWWVLERALGQLKAWREMLPGLRMSVNLSARSLANGSVPDRVVTALGEAGLPPEALILELTESSMMTDAESSTRALRELRGLGIGLALDDYGTGYSSLSRLKDLPFNDLKIDGEFVREMVNDRADEAIVRSTIELARNLGRTVVAEGVEDKTTLHRLASLGCHTAQGFYLARPQPAAECELWLAASVRWPATVANGGGRRQGRARAAGGPGAASWSRTPRAAEA